MFRNKYVSLALTAILVITAIFGSTRALAQSGTGPKTAVVQNGDEPPYLKHGRITPADRQAAADRRAHAGGSTGLTGTTGAGGSLGGGGITAGGTGGSTIITGSGGSSNRPRVDHCHPPPLQGRDRGPQEYQK